MSTMEINLSRPEAPATISKRDFGTPSTSERKLINVSFASLSDGGAAMRTRIVPSSSSSTISLRLARGVTRTASAEPLLPSCRLNLRSDIVYLEETTRKLIDESEDCPQSVSE